MVAYATFAEGDTYFVTRLNSDAWDDETVDANKTAALTMATNIIDRLNFKGTKVTTAQVLQFPRNDDTVVPQDIKNASFEIGLALLDGVDPDLEFETLNMVSQGYGSARSTYDTSRPPENVLAGVPSMFAWRYLKPYLRDPLNIKISRVT